MKKRLPEARGYLGGGECFPRRHLSELLIFAPDHERERVNAANSGSTGRVCVGTVNNFRFLQIIHYFVIIYLCKITKKVYLPFLSPGRLLMAAEVF